MTLENFAYFGALLFTISYPLARSWEKRLQFHKHFKNLFLSTLIPALIFIVWDIIFTEIGVWSFNSDYITGFHILNLPIEEVMFFFVIPFSCIFIYEALRYFSKGEYLVGKAEYIYYSLSLILLVVGITHIEKLYTSVTFISAAVVFSSIIYFLKPRWSGTFLVAYLIVLLPFFIVNGFLTAVPIVQYNDLHNLGMRIYSIPIEDSIYGMLLLFMICYIYESPRK